MHTAHEVQPLWSKKDRDVRLDITFMWVCLCRSVSTQQYFVHLFWNCTCCCFNDPTHLSIYIYMRHFSVCSVFFGDPKKCKILMYDKVNLRSAVCQECSLTGAPGGDHRNRLRLAGLKQKPQSKHCFFWQWSQARLPSLPKMLWNRLVLFSESAPGWDPNYY